MKDQLGRILIAVGIILIPSAFAWTFVPFWQALGWGEYEFRARLLQRTAVSVCGFATLLLAWWAIHDGAALMNKSKKEAQQGKWSLFRFAARLICSVRNGE